MTTWLYPYPTLFGDVEVKVEALRVDGGAVPGNRVDADNREVRLLELDRAQWAGAELDVSISGPHTELRELAEEGAEPRAVIVAHCSASNGRQAVELKPDRADESTWHGTLELERSNWFGRVDLRGAIVATVEGVGNRVIGPAHPWAIRLDDVPPPPAHGAIDIVWHDFSAPDEHLSWLREYEAEPAFLRLDDDQPILYLNRAFEGLKALLDRKPAREPGEQALHDQTRATIATEAWGALFNAAVQAIRFEPNDEEPDWPEEPWKRTALEILVERMYPEKTADDALRELAERRSEPDGGGPLQQQLLTAVSEHVGVARLLRSAITGLGRNLREVS